MKKQNTFAALSASALALPAIQAQASAPPDDTTFSYRFSNYKEDPVDNYKGNEIERYNINVHQVNIGGGIDNISFNINGQFETLTGASAQVVMADGNGDLQYMSGASVIEEARNEVSAAVRYHMPTVELGLSGGVSDEDDYDSYYGGVDGTVELKDKTVTLNFGATYSQDTLFPTSSFSSTNTGDTKPNEVLEPGRLDAWQQDKQRWSVYQGTSFIVNRNTVAQIGFSYTNVSGYLSDPYREFEVIDDLDLDGDTLTADSVMVHYDKRPELRQMMTASTGLRSHIGATNSTVHLDYRFFSDDWGVISNTVDLQWYQRFNFSSDAQSGTMRWLQDTGSYVMLVPQVRYYQQSEAEFYQVLSYADGLPAASELMENDHYSSDARLSKYGALSWGGKMIVKIADVKLNAQIERYDAKAEYGFNDVANPALPQAWRWSTGFDFSF